MDEINDVLEELNNKVETVKAQIGLTGTDVIEALSEKANEIITWLSPISQSVNKITEINFDKNISEIKNKIEDSCTSIKSLIQEDLKIGNSEQLQKLSQDFEKLK